MSSRTIHKSVAVGISMPCRGYTLGTDGVIRRLHPKLRGKARVKAAKRNRVRGRLSDRQSAE